MSSLTFPLNDSGTWGRFDYTYPPGGGVPVGYGNSERRVFRSLNTASSPAVYDVRIVNLSFITSALPDNAAILGASLTNPSTTRYTNVDNRSITGEYYEWSNTNADYTLDAPTSGSNIAFLNGTIAQGPVTWTLTNLYNISTTGTTKLRLHVSGGSPSGMNDIFIGDGIQLTVVYGFYPTASFTVGGAGLSPTFINTSTDSDGSIVSSSWNFGDTQTSTTTSPTHTYAVGGTYTVTLTVTDDQGLTNSISKSVTVATLPPIANFTISGGTQGQSRTRTFTSTSSDPDGVIVQNYWNFGDGSPTLPGTTVVHATGTTVTHTFAGDGPYNVQLWSYDDQGAFGTTTKSVLLNNPPVPNFTVSGQGNSRTFANTSTDLDGTIVSNSWTFGDGGASNLTSPTHIWTSGGTYPVKLTVTDNLGTSRSLTKNVTILPNISPTANFSWTAPNLTATFVDASTDPDGTIASRLWTFGDGSSSTLVNPIHIFGGAGTYPVTLTVTDDWGGSDSHIVSVTVTDPPPVPVGVARSYLKRPIFARTATLAGPINATDDSAPIDELKYWPKAGVILVGGPVGGEKMSYQGKSAPHGPGSLTGVSRGLFNTTATTHSSGVSVGLLGRHDGALSTKRKIPTLPDNGAITLQELRRHEDSDYFALVELDNHREQVRLDVVGPPSQAGTVSTTFDENGTPVTRTTSIAAAKEVRTLTINNPQTASGDVSVTLNGVAKTFTLTGGIAAKWQIEILQGTTTSTDAFSIVYHDVSGVSQTQALSAGPGLSASQVADIIRNTTFSGWSTSGSGAVIIFTRSTLSSGQAQITDYGPTSGSSYRNTQLQEGASVLTAINTADLVRRTSFSGWQTGGTIGTSTVTFTALVAEARTGTYSYSAGSTGATSTSGITQTTAGSGLTSAAAAAAIRNTYAGNAYWTPGGSGSTVTWVALSSGAKQDATFSPGATGIQAQLQIANQGSTDLVAWIKDSLSNTHKRRVLANIANTTIFNIETCVSGAGTPEAIVSFWGEYGTTQKKLLWRVENVDLSQHNLGEIAYGVTAESSDALTWDVHTDKVRYTDRGEAYYRDHTATGKLIKQGYGFFILKPDQPRNDQFIQEFSQFALPGEHITIGTWVRWVGIPDETPARPFYVTAHHADGTVTPMGSLSTTGFSPDGVSGTSGWVYVYGEFDVPDGTGANRVPAYQYRITSRDISRGTIFFQELAASLGTTAKRTYLYAVNGTIRTTYTISTPRAVPNISVGRKRTALESLHETPTGMSAVARFRSAVDTSSFDAEWTEEADLTPDLPVVQIEDELDGDGLYTPEVVAGYPRIEYRILSGREILNTFLTKDRVELPGGVFFDSLEEWYPNPGVDVRILPSGRVRRQKVHEAVGLLPSMSLLSFRPEAIRYIQERWGTEEFIAEIDNEALTLKLLSKPEFKRATPPYGPSSDKAGYWVSSDVSAEVVEVRAIAE